MARHPLPHLLAAQGTRAEGPLPPRTRPVARKGAPLSWGRLLGLAAAAAGLAALAHGAWIPAKAVLAQALLAHAWAQAASSGAAVKPWPWADTWPVAKIAAPRLGRSAIVLHEAGGEAMAFGPTWLARTPSPGEPGVSVIAAHRDTHFRFLEKLAPGDRIEVVRADGERRAFTVSGAEIVRADASGIRPEGGPARLALVTCWPFGVATPGPLRYVVWAEAAAS